MRIRSVAVVLGVTVVAGCSAPSQLHKVVEDGAGGVSEGDVVRPGEDHWTYGLAALCVDPAGAAVVDDVRLAGAVGMEVEGFGLRAGPVDVFGAPQTLAELGIEPTSDVSTRCIDDSLEAAGFVGLYVQIGRSGQGRTGFERVELDWHGTNGSGGTMTIPYALTLCDAAPCDPL